MAKRCAAAEWLGRKSRVPINLEQNGAAFLIRLDAEVTIIQAAELKQLLLHALKEGKELRLDLEAATEMDITALQLLWAAHREAKKTGAAFFTAGRVPEELCAAAIDAGLEGFPVPIEAS
jgi:anti-anti-sigma regulatory factor